MIVPAIILSINIKQNLGNKKNYEPDEPFDIVIVDLFYLCNSYPRTDPWKDFRKYWKCAEKMRIPTERISINFYWKIFALVTKNSLETRGNIDRVVYDHGNYIESRFAALQNKNLLCLKKKCKTQTATFFAMQSKLVWWRWCEQ